jgi:D-alanyl-D-alanine carboxypeptidase/D-alanyl-D-alanine-endopeptidase (penicillin-binding protein 4)
VHEKTAIESPTTSAIRANMRLALCVLVFAFSIAPASTLAQGGEIREQLRTLVVDAALGERIGISVVDVESGREIFSQRGDLALNPASNMKLVTAAASLVELGPAFTMRTGVYGHIEDGRVADLILRGRGDPSLDFGALAELADALAARGVRAVDRLWVDGSYFDDQLLPPAFDQQPNETSAFRAAVSAVAVNRASFILRVMPARTVGQPAIVRLAGANYFQVDSQMNTTDGGAPNVIASQRPGTDGRMSLTLRGSVPNGILGVSYRRRVDDPLFHAGHIFAEALERAGMGGRRTVATGTGPSALPLLASHESQPLSALLHRVGKFSDNFYAEMILKVMGAERGTPGTSARGTQASQAILVRAGVAPDAATIINGSGLFDGNLIAARHLSALLRFMYTSPSYRPEYLAQLAIGGTDGTLRRRLRNLPAPRIVRAKTGTLNDAIALSGYVLGPTPDKVYAFSVLCNGIRGRQGQARRLADSIVTTIAQHLHP